MPPSNPNFQMPCCVFPIRMVSARGSYSPFWRGVRCLLRYLLCWHRNGLDALTLIFLTYRELGWWMREMKLLFLPIHTLPPCFPFFIYRPNQCFVNLLSETCNIDAAYAETLITSRTRAMARPPVWPFGWHERDMQVSQPLRTESHRRRCTSTWELSGTKVYQEGNHPLRAGNLGDTAAFSFIKPRI